MIDLENDVRLDENGALTVGETDEYLIQVAPMLYNDRIVLTPKNCTLVWDHGWCYDKGGAALIAVAIWEPDKEAEPPGYKKRACACPRIID